jgi:hypothetical protein
MMGRGRRGWPQIPCIITNKPRARRAWGLGRDKRFLKKNKKICQYDKYSEQIIIIVWYFGVN